MGAERQLQGAIVFDHLAPVRHRRQDYRRLQSFRAERRLAGIGGGEQRERCLAEPAHLPQALAAILSQCMEGACLG